MHSQSGSGAASGFYEVVRLRFEKEELDGKYAACARKAGEWEAAVLAFEQAFAEAVRSNDFQKLGRESHMNKGRTTLF